MKQDKFVIASLYLLIFGILGSILFIGYPIWLPHKDFDSEAWKKGDPTERSRMIDDLFDRRLAIGKSEKELQDLFGQPEEKWSNVWYYRVNCGVGASSTGILMEFDQIADTVIGVRFDD